jgi:hypothetical protein
MLHAASATRLLGLRERQLRASGGLHGDVASGFMLNAHRHTRVTRSLPLFLSPTPSSLGRAGITQAEAIHYVI